MSTRTSIFALAIAFGLTGAGAAIAEEGQRQTGEPPMLMEERAGATGVPEQQKPAEQDDDLAGAGDRDVDEQTRAATGTDATAGSLQFGDPEEDDSLQAQRQGVIGTPESPPEPVEQGGGGSGQ